MRNFPSIPKIVLIASPFKSLDVPKSRTLIKASTVIVFMERTKSGVFQLTGKLFWAISATTLIKEAPLKMKYVFVFDDNTSIPCTSTNSIGIT